MHKVKHLCSFFVCDGTVSIDVEWYTVGTDDFRGKECYIFPLYLHIKITFPLQDVQELE
jgi:hypothetical protein